MIKICSKCYNEYDNMFMPWQYAIDTVGTEFIKIFMCPYCKSVLLKVRDNYEISNY